MRNLEDIVQQIIEADEMYKGKTPSLAGFSHMDFQDYTNIVDDVNKELKVLNINAIFSATSYGFNVDFTEAGNE